MGWITKGSDFSGTEALNKVSNGLTLMLAKDKGMSERVVKGEVKDVSYRLAYSLWKRRLWMVSTCISSLPVSYQKSVTSLSLSCSLLFYRR